MTIFAAQTCGNGKATTSFHFIVQPSPFGTSPTSRQRSSRKYRSDKKSAWAAVLLVCQVAEHSLPHSFPGLAISTLRPALKATSSPSPSRTSGWGRPRWSTGGTSPPQTPLSPSGRSAGVRPGWVTQAGSSSSGSWQRPRNFLCLRSGRDLSRCFSCSFLAFFVWKFWVCDSLSVVLFSVLQILSHRLGLYSLSYVHNTLYLVPHQSGRPTLNSRLLNSLEDRGNSSGGGRTLSSSHDLRKNVFLND